MAFVSGISFGNQRGAGCSSVCSRSTFLTGAVPATSRRRASPPSSVSHLRMQQTTTATTSHEFITCPGATGTHADCRIAKDRSKVLAQKGIDRPVIIGVAADSGCGKSTFLRRVTDIFGTKVSKSHTPQGDFMTVICLDDFHTHDRQGRKIAKVTALSPDANNFELMYQQVNALREGKAIMKPIYNHETGLIDPPELIEPNHVIVIEGLHPIYDDRVREILDYSIYLDVADEVKLSWKVQRDMSERGHSYDAILASIQSRIPDFKAYVDPQKEKANVVMNILPTQLVADDKDNKYLRVQLIQEEGIEGINNVFLYDEGSTIDWVPCGRKLTCPFPGIKFHYGPDTYAGKDVSMLEVDGNFAKLDELIYVESHLNNTGTKFYGEITQSLLRNPTAPGSNNGTGLFQVLLALKMREVYERVSGKIVAL
eukprot:CAMPEP_0184686354 /NCGR_PEP_ID=MMETSP0312-20130426/22116_1 /TAXON_ID=31354 /ORGANISM="Compsopogon coeruleus, Strain SAG 36.94" /LENGTH=425 /DNA_ID=CAMNT_0027141341 /DNA_START=47 /DNA_END=1324 /DNA_ORIENTATION=+